MAGAGRAEAGTIWWVWLLARSCRVHRRIWSRRPGPLAASIADLARAAIALPGGRPTSTPLNLKSRVHRFPAVPMTADLKNSPGTTLAYRCRLPRPQLEIVRGSDDMPVLECAGGRAPHDDGRKSPCRPDGLVLAIFCVPFVVVGLWLCYYFARQFLSRRHRRDTPGISDHPLLPGRSTSRCCPGWQSFRSIRWKCCWSATSRHVSPGDDTVVDTRRTCQQQIFS